MLARLACCITVATVAAMAQNQPTPPTFRTQTSYVRVDVYATMNGTAIHDLSKDDFEVSEDRRPQTIVQFEHVVVPGTTATTEREDPRSLEESRKALQNPRARVFVVFLDVNQVDRSGSFRVRQPLIDALNRLIGPDDLFAVMTPQMTPDMLSFVRRTDQLADVLARHWDWGRKDNSAAKDDREQICEVQNPGDPALVEEAMSRRREHETLTTLLDLQEHLRLVREERKAIITVTPGWVLYPPNPAVGRLRGGCGSDVANMDNTGLFQELIDRANRANVSFYPIDPRGLAVFDASITRPLTPGPGKPLSGFNLALAPETDHAQFEARRNSLREIASGTDGLAMFNSNDLGSEFKKIVDDLSSYYLLGYYSPAGPDGRFHTISVRVKRAGVQVRARRGYVASSAATKPTTAVAIAAARLDPVVAAVNDALRPLDDYARELPFRSQVAVGWIPGGPQAKPVVFVEGELRALGSADDRWTGGAIVTIELRSAASNPITTTRIDVAATARSFRTAVPVTAPLDPGSYILRIVARPSSGAGAVTEVHTISLTEDHQASGAMWMRRGPSTVNRQSPTADLRYRRSDQLTLEIPQPDAAAKEAQLLERNGNPLPVPLAVSVRQDPDGSSWMVVEVPVAALGIGNYVVQIRNGDRTTMWGFKVIP